MTSKKPPEHHVADASPEEIRERLKRIKAGSVDGGLTVPQPKQIPAFDARTATPEEIERFGREHGMRIKRSI